MMPNYQGQLWKGFYFLSIAVLLCGSLVFNVSRACGTGQCHNNNSSECNSYCNQFNCSNPKCGQSTNSCAHKCSCSGCSGNCSGSPVSSCGSITDKSTCANHYVRGSSINMQCKWEGNTCINGGETCVTPYPGSS